ncbi:hypothetical protein Fot_42431 [Forsythia ovata]|uniref:Uncharacterized protein n=1 Tax=Forsythia ovata TaxID=205694 RepID=A0ABD1RL52_9LAMI
MDKEKALMSSNRMSHPPRPRYNHRIFEVNDVDPGMTYNQRGSSLTSRDRRPPSPRIYCRYHHMHAHDITECVNMISTIEDLIVENELCSNARQSGEKRRILIHP